MKQPPRFVAMAAWRHPSSIQHSVSRPFRKPGGTDPADTLGARAGPVVHGVSWTLRDGEVGAQPMFEHAYCSTQSALGAASTVDLSMRTSPLRFALYPKESPKRAGRRPRLTLIDARGVVAPSSTGPSLAATAAVRADVETAARSKARSAALGS